MAERDTGEDWHIAEGTTVLLAGPDGLSMQLHESGATGERKSEADILLTAFVARAYRDPAWVADLKQWWLDRGREPTGD